MAKYILKRLLLMLMTMFVIMTFMFILIRLLPLNIVPSSPLADVQAKRDALMKMYGLDKPIMVQFFIFVKGVITKFDWGFSTKIKFLEPVTSVLGNRIGFTMIVNLYAFLISVPLGVMFGVTAALKKNKLPDYIISVGVMLFISVPSYVYAFLLQYILSFELDIFPLIAKSGTDLFSWSMFVSLCLPVMALSFGPIAVLTRYTRAELTEVLTSDFMLLARTKGLSRRQATYRHAFRNSLVVVMPIIIGQFIGILGGSIVIERIFAIPGIGDLFLKAINERDYSVFMFEGMFYVTIGLVGALVVDLTYGLIDPRIRMGGKKSES